MLESDCGGAAAARFLKFTLRCTPIALGPQQKSLGLKVALPCPSLSPSTDNERVTQKQCSSD